jgi:multidrug efflux pump subunit AcrB
VPDGDARWSRGHYQHACGPVSKDRHAVVVVATFYNGMPPQQIEADITNTFERFFTLAANVDHSESRSLTGVSLIKIYFKSGTNADAALSNVAKLAMADLRRLPQGTLPPVVLGMDASTQPVCLVTLKGQRLNEMNLKDLAQFQVRNQISKFRAHRFLSRSVGPTDKSKSTWTR